MTFKRPTVRQAFDYDTDQVSQATGMEFDPEEGRTQQSFRDEVDINTIVERFGLTGELPDNMRLPQSGDFTGITDFHTAMSAVRQAQEQFMQLPGAMRERFNHDPQRLLSFLEDPGNLEEARKLGLVNPEAPKPARTAVEAIDELAKAMTAPTKV